MKTLAPAILTILVSVIPGIVPATTPVDSKKPVRLERPGDPPASAETVNGRATDKTSARIERNGYLSVQVNTDAENRNIRGDAANEPSITIDPTAPNRMAIGWRQFDSVSSNHREAGIAFSNDGGRTWTMRESLEDGIFRSDPVLDSDAEGHFFYNSLSIPGGRLLADFFDSIDGGKSWTGPAPAFGGDKVWVTIDRTDSIGRGNIYQSWSTASNEWGERVFSRSTDGGRTWSEPIALQPPPIWGTLTVGPDGELYIAGNAAFNLDIFIVLRSLDARDPLVDEPSFRLFFVDLGGAQGIGDGTFDTPNPVGLLGQVWLGVDTSNGPNRGNLYLLSSVDPPGPDPQDVHFTRSTDGGETWSDPIRVNTDDRNAWQWFGTMSVAPDGRIDVVWIESLDGETPNVGELYFTSSDDGGLTWADAEAITPVFDSHLGFPRQDKMGDYFHMRSDLVGADLAYAATFNGEQDVYYLRIGDRDCDGNGIGDTEDLAAGRLDDCDGNSIPDSCDIAARPEIDVNGDGRVDVCEIPPRRGAGRSAP